VNSVVIAMLVVSSTFAVVAANNTVFDMKSVAVEYLLWINFIAR